MHVRAVGHNDGKSPQNITEHDRYKPFAHQDS